LFGVCKRLRIYIKIMREGSTVSVRYPVGFGEMRMRMFHVGKRSEIWKVKRFVSRFMRRISRRFYGLSAKRGCIYDIKIPNGNLKHEEAVFLVDEWEGDITLAIRKYQRWSDYPCDLYMWELIPVLRLIALLKEKELHQIQDGEPKWLYYTL